MGAKTTLATDLKQDHADFRSNEVKETANRIEKDLVISDKAPIVEKTTEATVVVKHDEGTEHKQTFDGEIRKAH